MLPYTRLLTDQEVPQNEPLDDSQVMNSAGGYVNTVDKWVALERFIILGSDGGTYYVKPEKLTKDNLERVSQCIVEDGVRVVNTVVEISDAGRAPKNDPALLVLAACLKTGNPETRSAAAKALPKVARIGTHLYHFAEYVELFGGWGRLTKKAFSDWYTNRSTKSLANQIVKYQSRDGWSHADIIRLAHVKTSEEAKNVLFRYSGAKYADTDRSTLDLNHQGLELVIGFEKAQAATSVKEIVSLITDYSLPRECVPTKFLKNAEVWSALLPHMGLTAMIRNLGNMSKAGVLNVLSPEQKFVTNAITDEHNLAASRIHPIAILTAIKTYAGGRGFRGSSTWTVNQRVVDALNSAFYNSFGNVEPTNKNTMLALDVSGSMGWCAIAGSNLTAREVTAAMALVTANVEPNYCIMGFTNTLKELPISPDWRLDQVVNYLSGMSFGSTDCALPALYALENKIPVDAFVIYTDSETWCGKIHARTAIKHYREKFVGDAKMIVCGTNSTDFTIANPNDPNSLDVVGFDASVPTLISNFIKG